MSAIQSGGSSGSGAGQGPRAGNRRPPGPKPASGSGARPKTSRGGGGKGGGGKRPNSDRRPGGPVPAGPPRRFSASMIAFTTIAVVVVVVVVLVVVKITGGSPTNPNSTGPSTTPAQASVLAAISAVTPAEAANVGLPSSVTPPKLAKNQPALTSSNGQPAALYIGAEFCPYCAAERWAIVMAFSRFGSFSGLKETTSSPYDADPSTATFTFYGATYTSQYLHFDAVEHEGNDTTAPGTRSLLVKLTTAQSNLWSKYEAQFSQQEGFPFVDIGNKVFVVAPSYNPAILAGLDQSAIAAKLSNPGDQVTQAIVGTANYITAALCSIAGNQPSVWCSASAVKAAAHAMGLS